MGLNSISGPEETRSYLDALSFLQCYKQLYAVLSIIQLKTTSNKQITHPHVATIRSTSLSLSNLPAPQNSRFSSKSLRTPINGDRNFSGGKMNDGDVSRQIQQMVRFIRQEAEEKANEISVSAEEVRSLSVSLPISSDLLISLDFNRDSISVYNGRIADFVSD